MKENAVTKPVRDTFLLSLSTALATVIQALVTFGLTKLIPTEDFGAWREFVLAAGFTGRQLRLGGGPRGAGGAAISGGQSSLCAR